MQTKAEVPRPHPFLHTAALLAQQALPDAHQARPLAWPAPGPVTADEALGRQVQATALVFTSVKSFRFGVSVLETA